MPADVHGLEERKLALEERKLALEESAPKKWGSVISGAFATFIISILTLGFNVYQYIDQSGERGQEIDRKNIDLTRNALDLYFKSVQVSTSPEERISHLAMFSAIVKSDDVRNVFLQMRDEAIKIVQLKENITVTEAVQRFPSLPGNGAAGGKIIYTVYVQYKKGNEAAKQKADSLRDKLSTLGYRVPGIEGVEGVPDKTTLRFYTTSQKRDVGTSLMSTVKAEIGAGDFGDEVLQKANLPVDTFEIWVGLKATAR